MSQKSHFTYLVNILISFSKLFLVILVLMSIARVYLFLSYGGASTYNSSELFDSFLLGVRLDASALGYIYSLPILFLFFIWALKIKFFNNNLYKIFRVYFILLLTILSCFTFADLIYFSYFGEHSTLMIFGVIDDDTEALFNTALKDYNITLAVLFSVVYFATLYYVILKIIKNNSKVELDWSISKQTVFFISIILLTAYLGRGGLGTYPLYRYIPDTARDNFINNLPQSSAFAIGYSYKQYKKSKSGNYNVSKIYGYDNNIEKAFVDYTHNENIDKKDLLSNITNKTTKNPVLKNKKPHVVVVMVESFGMPLLEHQSEKFNIMGALKKHFDEDTLFTNFISGANGTIVSLEPTLLNIPAMHLSTSFSQGKYLNTSFKQASARVYEKAGYETSFVYGGDVSWRNVGNFMSRQGFDNIEGRGKIAESLNTTVEDISHDWGVFDEYLYNYVYKKLSNAKKPQFIFILTTNNHPPHIIPKHYKSKKLEMPEKLKKQIVGDMTLTKKRLKDYAYAVDMAGVFMDKIKSSSLAKNSVVAITADNNTIEGIMHYDNYYTETKRIPFYIYIPEYLKPKKRINTLLPSSHKDIFPTLYNLTLYNKSYIATGTNLLDESTLHCGFNNANVIMAKDGGFKLSKAKSEIQKQCQKYYKATMVIADYLIKSNKK